MGYSCLEWFLPIDKIKKTSGYVLGEEMLDRLWA